jgi:hypothetical protein
MILAAVGSGLVLYLYLSRRHLFLEHVVVWRSEVKRSDATPMSNALHRRNMWYP